MSSKANDFQDACYDDCSISDMRHIMADTDAAQRRAWEDDVANGWDGLSFDDWLLAVGGALEERIDAEVEAFDDEHGCSLTPDCGNGALVQLSDETSMAHGHHIDEGNDPSECVSARAHFDKALREIAQLLGLGRVEIHASLDLDDDVTFWPTDIRYYDVD